MEALFYIDPGTGSMLFTVVIGLVSAGVYALRGAMVKLHFLLSGGRKEAGSKADVRAPFAIFAEGKQYWNVFEPICNEFERQGIDLRYLTGSPDDPALTKEYKHVRCEFVGEGNRGFAHLNMLQADVVLSTTPGLDVYQWKRSRDVAHYAHILHAISDATMYRMFGLDFYDSVLLSGQFQVDQVRALEHLRGLPAKETPIVGLTYMDAMRGRLLAMGAADITKDSLIPTEATTITNAAQKKSNTTDSAQVTPDKTLDKTAHKTTVLLAPSWGPSAIFSLYGGRIIEALLNAGYHVVVRPHPQSFKSETELIEQIMHDFPASDRLEWNRDTDNFDVLRRSDILISDFSGVIFDFALVFDKPVIYTEPAFDPAPYDACWLDEQPWTFTTLPKIGYKLQMEYVDNIQELVEQCLADETLQTGRDAAREQCWSYPGESAKRTVDFLVRTREQILATRDIQDQ